MAQLVGAVEPEGADELVDDLLNQFGSLSQIFSASAARIAVTTGSKLLADILSSARDAVFESMREQVQRATFDIRDRAVHNYLVAMMQGESEEHLHAIYLDGHGALICEERIASGSISQVTLRLRALLRRAIELDSSRLVLFHNHPSGKAYPSCQDIDLTIQISKNAANLGIELVDHLIVAGPSVFSMKHAGLLR